MQNFYSVEAQQGNYQLKISIFKFIYSLPLKPYSSSDWRITENRIILVGDLSREIYFGGKFSSLFLQQQGRHFPEVHEDELSCIHTFQISKNVKVEFPWTQWPWVIYETTQYGLKSLINGLLKSHEDPIDECYKQTRVFQTFSWSIATLRPGTPNCLVTAWFGPIRRFWSSTALSCSPATVASYKSTTSFPKT